MRIKKKKTIRKKEKKNTEIIADPSADAPGVINRLLHPSADVSARAKIVALKKPMFGFFYLSKFFITKTMSQSFYRSK